MAAYFMSAAATSLWRFRRFACYRLRLRCASRVTKDGTLPHFVPDRRGALLDNLARSWDSLYCQRCGRACGVAW